MKSYECSIHGKDGNPNCAECWKTLDSFLSDKNALAVGTWEDIMKLEKSRLKEDNKK